MIIQVMKTVWTETHKAIELRVFQEIFVVKDVASKSGAGSLQPSKLQAILSTAHQYPVKN
jgi:hypothetical protein